MMEDEGADAGFRVHHHAFGEVDADFLRTQEEPDAGLVFEVRTSRITKTVALAAIARGEAVGHGERWRIGEAPIFADSAMQPFGAGFGCFNRQRLKAVRKKIAAGGFCCFGAVAAASACTDYKTLGGCAGAIRCGDDVVAQAEIAGWILTLEMKSVNWRACIRCVERDRISVALGFKELPTGRNFNERGRFAPDFFHVVE